ncbi:hypothetical protein [Methanobrevibacter sp. UBA337]|jgi:hypothetical protein|uniref:hypothetical protein n=1 Tax=Methanobrevibacter sp. UBA337 TaxID=1915480 RepID=UPI0039B94368
MVKVVHKTHDELHKLFENLGENDSVDIIMDNGYVMQVTIDDTIVLDGTFLIILAGKYKRMCNLGNIRVLECETTEGRLNG